MMAFLRWALGFGLAVISSNGLALATHAKQTDSEQTIPAPEQHPRQNPLPIYEQWVYKFRQQKQQKYAEPELLTDIEKQLANHANEANYLQQTAEFLVNWQSAFPDSLIQHAIQTADQHPEPGMPSVHSDFERERAENIEDPRKQVKALGDWLAKYPNDAFYSNEVRKERLDVFGDLGQISESERAFLDLETRVPHEADLYATMASIYIRRRTKIAEALSLLDKAEENLDLQRLEPDSGYIVILDPGNSEEENAAILNYWRAKALLEQHQSAKAEQLLQQAVPRMDDATGYELLARLQEQQHRLDNAKQNYLQAAIRSSEHENEYIRTFVKFSMTTGNSREAAIKEVEQAQATAFAAQHYIPSLIDRTLPDFAFSTADGNKITPADLRGKTVLLDFWSTWCGPCVSELSDFEKIQQRHPEVKVLLVATGSKLPEVKKVLREQGVSKTNIALDSDGQVNKFGLNGVPQTYIVDPNGHIRVSHYGSMDYAISELEADLASVQRAKN